ncbi:MAG: hypothetical protein DHS20C16_22660 [Phycisphaerae bacterium]|nr:MAG: hypothetical protein DHS20C16_22660 [Phycisphaerae bacterium]
MKIPMETNSSDWAGIRIAAVALVVFAVGCVKRAEIVAVLPDGQVELVSYFHGDKDDILGASDPDNAPGDPPPSAANGWNVEIKKNKENDKDKATLIATMSLEPGRTIPKTYATPNSLVSSAATRFHTDVSIEQTSDGTYYHFNRVYVRRLWAPFEYHRKRILESDNIKALMEKEPKSMTDADRKVVVDAMVAVESEQQVELLDIAIAATGGNISNRGQISQLAQLAAIKRVREVTSEPDLRKKVMDSLVSTNGTQDSTDLEADLHRRVDDAVAKALTGAGISEAIASATVRSLHLARRDFQVSKDLEDESWDVQVVLPGRIVAHNATDDPESIDVNDLNNTGDEKDDPIYNAALTLSAKLKPFVETPGFQNCSWSFESDALHDRDVVLMATSFVPKGK